MNTIPCIDGPLIIPAHVETVEDASKYSLRSGARTEVSVGSGAAYMTALSVDEVLALIEGPKPVKAPVKKAPAKRAAK